MSIPRFDEEGFRWAEELLGGRIVAKRKHNRWRPQWFLDVERPDSSIRPVLLRGFRNPGYTASDEQGARDWLEVESEILRTLETLPITVPGHLGYNHELGWLLMDRLDGDADITDVTDADRQFTAYRGYMEELAKLHAIPLSSIDLSPKIPHPGTTTEHRQRLMRDHITFFRKLDRTEPEPILELGIQWVLDHDIPTERPLALGLGDVGPGQFLFVGDRFRSLIDFEYGMIADPFMEIGMMRARALQYPIPRLPEHILHYGKIYAEASGQPFDLDAIRYWTVAGPALWTLMSNAGVQHQMPEMIDLVFLLSWETQQKRAVIEAMAEYHGIQLTPPTLPIERTSLLGPLVDTLTGQFDRYYAPRAKDPAEEAFVTYSAALSRTIARGNATLGEIDSANMDELGALLGCRPDDWFEGMWAFERLIAEDYARDFEARLRFLYNVSMRREFLYAPMQIATGCGTNAPVARFDDVPGVRPSAVPIPQSRSMSRVPA
jgi:aminoglycoside phosphotransferase (APT) family kinase protein